ncbi:MAG: hypothetical protein ACOYNS_14750 [Bacteroidota bacterium]
MLKDFVPEAVIFPLMPVAILDCNDAAELNVKPPVPLITFDPRLITPLTVIVPLATKLRDKTIVPAAFVELVVANVKAAEPAPLIVWVPVPFNEIPPPAPKVSPATAAVDCVIFPVIIIFPAPVVLIFKVAPDSSVIFSNE